MSTVASPTTLELIAKEAGVSVRTVYRVLQGENKESWPSAQRRGKLIRQISQRMGFIPDSSARSLRTGQKMQIAVLLRNTEGGEMRSHYPEAFEIILGINEVMEQAGYGVHLATIGDVLHPRNAHSRIFREHMVDGLIVISTMPDNLLGVLKTLTPACLWVHSNIWGQANCLRRDETNVGQQIAERMIGLGYRRLIWVGPWRQADESRHYSETQRLDGVQAVVQRHGVQLEQVLANSAGELADQFGHIGAMLRPDVGVIAYSTEYARWLTHCAGSLRLQAPLDFGLACCDESRILKSHWPGLCRIGFDQLELGRQAGEMMIENLETDQEIKSRLVRGSWIIGDTAWGPPADSAQPHRSES